MIWSIPPTLIKDRRRPGKAAPMCKKATSPQTGRKICRQGFPGIGTSCHTLEAELAITMSSDLTSNGGLYTKGPNLVDVQVLKLFQVLTNRLLSRSPLKGCYIGI